MKAIIYSERGFRIQKAVFPNSTLWVTDRSLGHYNLYYNYHNFLNKSNLLAVASVYSTMEILQQPSIYILGIRIDEPMTTFTDLIVSFVCFYAFYKLSKKNLPGRTQFFFKYYFLLMGIATGIGGLIGHGFLYLFSFSWKLPGWITSMISVALIERSAIQHAKPFIKPGVGKTFLAINVIELIIIMAITMATLNFKWVEFHSGYGLLAIVAPFHLWVYYKTRDRGSLFVLGGVALASLAALFYMNQISLHTWFNYLDISHTVMAIAAYVFYLGAENLGNREVPISNKRYNILSYSLEKNK